jgi:uncharacterized membrane protein
MEREKSIRGTIAGLAVGAGIMYFMDPVYGRRRRARIRDKGVRFRHLVKNAASPTARDLANRSRGLAASLFRKLRPGSVDDQLLTARIRSGLGRWVSHAHAVHVEAQKGRISLSGLILESEARDLVRRVEQVPGVKGVEDRLERHRDEDHVPALQGGGARREPRFEFLQSHWAPAPRLLAGMAGSATAMRGVRRGGLSGAAMTITGALLCARALTNMELKRLLGIGAGRKAIDLQKTLNIDADPQLVFDLWCCYENFPLFMSHVKKVEDLGDSRFLWVVSGPAGVPVNFIARVTKCVPCSELAWKTEGNSEVQHAGIIQFDPIEGGKTRVQIRFSYNPPAGAAGHLLTSLMGADPKKRMDEDLARMKTFIETGVRPHDAAAPLTPDFVEI